MKAHAALWLAFAVALAVAFKCAGRDDAKAQTTPEELIESQPTGAGGIEGLPRPGYFRKATP